MVEVGTHPGSGAGAAVPASPPDDASVEVLLAAEDGFILKQHQRYQLVGYWHSLWHESSTEELRRLADRYKERLPKLLLSVSLYCPSRFSCPYYVPAEACCILQAAQAERNELRDVSDLKRLRKAEVVGMTTSGAAKMQGLVKALRARILVVEEAAEVLEAHVLAAMHEGLQQLVLIGDHKQLRPKIESYRLSYDSGRGFNLDVSMFERLIYSAGIQYTTLQTQWRMRPEIAGLIKATVYPSLQDASTVGLYPQVRGMQQPLFMLTHTVLEDVRQSVGDQDKSRSNAYEADMAVGLASYLLKQGCYGDNDVVILTPYLGQVREIRRRAEAKISVVVSEEDLETLNLWEEGEGGLGPGEMEARPLSKRVRISSVDNFQGEESKVRLLGHGLWHPQKAAV